MGGGPGEQERRRLRILKPPTYVGDFNDNLDMQLSR